MVTVNQDENSAVIEVEYNGQTLYIDLDITQVVQATITVVVKVRADVQEVADADGDGVPDNEDDYPNDPDRATVIRIPAEGFYRVAYEDLYPKRGDAE